MGEETALSTPVYSRCGPIPGFAAGLVESRLGALSGLLEEGAASCVLSPCCGLGSRDTIPSLHSLGFAATTRGVDTGTHFAYVESEVQSGQLTSPIQQSEWVPG